MTEMAASNFILRNMYVQVHRVANQKNRIKSVAMNTKLSAVYEM